ncbi:MAG TPA: hypothetical protein VGO63_00615 [Candidatus Paceibacterota bacterium]|jgi:hypothetical protein|nr:hypothetical protein [Candidatus Paceibacterota bacterium]
MNTYTKKARPGEITLYKEILNQIADEYNKSFSILILPKLISINTNTNTITLPFYEGQIFNNLWDKFTAGSLLDIDLASEVPQILKDLVKVNISDIIKNKNIKNIPDIMFQQSIYLSELDIQLRKFLDADLLKKEDAERVVELLKKPYVSTMIFNNGDFYPRNFIRSPEKKIVLIDWEIKNPHSPFYIIDYLENVAAVCFIHMWKNIPWQEKYIYELQKILPVTKKDFQKGILIKSLQMADFWFKGDGKNGLCRDQLNLFKKALSEEYMNKLWGND